MFYAAIENSYGERLDLTGNQNYSLYKIEGLGPPKATINTTQTANHDGSRFNSSRTEERNIVIYMAIEGNCEANRINLYKYVRTKQNVRFYYQNGARDVYIDGYVEDIQIGVFDMKQRVQISIICPYPYFSSNVNTLLNFDSVEPRFVFEFSYEQFGDAFSTLVAGQVLSVINAGDIENGIQIKLTAIGRALNPIIYNHTTGETFKINVDMFAGDTLEIDTRKLHKKVILTHDGVTTNVINNIQRGSTWFQLRTGDNLFSYGADEFPENLSCFFLHSIEYEGV